MSIGGLFKDIDVMWENLLHASNTTLSPLRILRIKLEVDYGLEPPRNDQAWDQRP